VTDEEVLVTMAIQKKILRLKRGVDYWVLVEPGLLDGLEVGARLMSEKKLHPLQV
jgi:hypothetical protein